MPPARLRRQRRRQGGGDCQRHEPRAPHLEPRTPDSEPCFHRHVFLNLRSAMNSLSAIAGICSSSIADPQDVEVRAPWPSARLRPATPRARPARARRAPRDITLRAPGLDVERLDPARRHGRQLEGERAVDQDEEDVVRRVELSAARAARRPAPVEQEVGDDRDERRLPHEAGERHAEAAGPPDLAAALRGTGRRPGSGSPGSCPMRGRTAERSLEAGVERDQAEHVLEEHGRHADRADRAGDRRGDRHAVDAAARRERARPRRRRRPPCSAARTRGRPAG